MRRFFVFAAAVLLSVSAPMAYALGFGEIQLESALNQPLKAEIPLLAVKPAERDQVSVEIASIETFKRFGIDRPAVLDQIDTQVVPGSSNTRLRVLVSSRVAIQEPFLTFLLEANWPEGRAIREYTVLLDPPIAAPVVYSSPTPATTQPAAPPPAAAPLEPIEPAPAPAPVTVFEPAPIPAPASPQQTASPSSASQIESKVNAKPSAQPAPAQQQIRQYGPVAPSETLWSIASETRPGRGITQDQMMLAIYQANQNAFENNINLIRAGAMLDIPGAAEIRGIDQLVARNEVRDQARSFKAATRKPAPVAKTQTAQKPADKPKLKLEPATANNSDEPTTSETVATQDSTSDAPGLASAQNIPGQVQAPESAQNDGNPGEKPSLSAANANADTTEADQLLAARSASDGGSPENPESGLAATDPSTPESNPGEQAQQLAATSDSNDGSGPQATPTGDVASSGLEARINGQNLSSASPDASANTDPGFSGDGSAQSNQEQSRASASQQTDAGQAGQRGDSNNSLGVDAFVAGESVAPKGAGALITPQRLLLLLGIILLVVALLMFWNRRRYKAVPADFKLDQDEPDAAAGAQHAPAGNESRQFAAVTAAQPEPIDVDEVLADADSHIAFELYDEALAALALGLDANPRHVALQRKVLEVHHAADDEATFFERLNKYFPNITSDQPEWPAIAAMARDFRPDDARFASVEADTPAEASLFDETPGGDPPAPDTVDEAATQNDLTDEFAFPASTETVSEPADATETDFAPPTTNDWGATDEAEDSQSKTSPQPGFTPADDELQDYFATGPADTGFTESSTPDDAAPGAEEDKPSTSNETYDFDLSDFDTVNEPEPGHESALESTTDASPEAVQAPEQDAPDAPLNFDISELELSDDSPEGNDAALFDAPEFDADATPSAEQHNKDKGTDSDLSDLDWPQGFGVESEPSAGTQEPPAPDLIPEDTSASEPQSPEVAEFEIEEVEDPAETDDLASANEPISDADDGADEMPVDEDEIITKLDLARAYIDMGEMDMAQSLLQDVQTQGNVEQQRDAQNLLKRCG